ncbi:MAG: hypothetical protein M3419_04765 [Actinomycetota bacterium]|nr:hypothetical protein [Actinomycetota bacterium]
MNFDQDTEDGARNRLIGFSVLGLVAVGVVVGLLVGGLGLAAVRTADIGTDEESTSQPPTETSAEPSQTTEPEPSEPEPSEPEPTEPEPTEPEPSDRPTRDPDRAVLRASPQQVATFDEIDLTGRMPAVGAGVTLQVQRRFGDTAWSDFPVNPVTGDNGAFSTVVQTGVVGRNEFRLVDPTSGATTPRAVVEVG